MSGALGAMGGLSWAGEGGDGKGKVGSGRGDKEEGGGRR